MTAELDTWIKFDVSILQFVFTDCTMDMKKLFTETPTCGTHIDELHDFKLSKILIEHTDSIVE